MNKQWSEVGGWLIDVNIRPKLDKALTQFVNRIDDDLMRRLGQQFICIIDCAVRGSTIRILDVPCAPHSGQTLRHQVNIVVFRPEVERLSDEAALGEVAHAFARLALRLDQRIDTETIPLGEHMADNLAAMWGFKEEIDANLAEWGTIDATTRGRARSRLSSLFPPAKPH